MCQLLAGQLSTDDFTVRHNLCDSMDFNFIDFFVVNNSTAEHRLVLQFEDHDKLFECVKEGGQSKAKLVLLKRFVEKYDLVNYYEKNQDNKYG